MDLKSLGASRCTSSILVPGTNDRKGFQVLAWKPFSLAFDSLPILSLFLAPEQNRADSETLKSLSA
jgi:hypothetical protein